ncbi:RNA-binding protein 38 isoform X2 [Manihot esculenta]|uniref:Uncharacterized protein n=2 Tax=Manihot esculenta TaxID=3983 RepID=A0ACB7G2H8_MANES|nr:RNA-binding protein 38 isoform X2 [Manihot esculenta]KAG8632921.1 hypothetical protein MANES_18G066101v8 [Manihot esculenta]
MAYPHYRSQFGDTTFTKVFVGGLAWETPTDEMRRYFEQFGEILEAVIITDKNTGKSKGYGFVTFRDPESAGKACADPNPVIDGRKANCNIASLRRPRPSTPGKPQGDAPYQGSPSYSGAAKPLPPPPPPPPPPVIYPHLGYPPYPPEYGCHQAIYNAQVQHPQYYHQVYGTSSSSSSAVATPYYYHGYSLPRYAPNTHRLAGPATYFYCSNLDLPPPTTIQPTPHDPFPSSSDSQHPSTETQVGVVTSEISNLSLNSEKLNL